MSNQAAVKDVVPEGWVRPKTSPMGKDWKSRLCPQTEANIAASPNPAGSEELRNRLLALGGEEVCFWCEEDLDKILSRGFAEGCNQSFRKMAACRCHQNACELWQKNKLRVSICTGYALSPDGVWRQHSWAVDKMLKKVGKGNGIVETTEPRVAYYGFRMTAREADRFCRDNLA